jgi:tRNA(Ile)-lysidine synthase
MLNDFLKYIEENRLVRKGDSVLVAVSGGIDSMVMTDLFLKSGFRFGIAHCNFCLRKSESDKDEEMVSKFAAKHNIPFYSIRFRTEDYAEENGISIEMAARELRYEWFEKIRQEKGFDSIAVAHNLNDNIETLLLNLIRGTGIAGLTGMRNSGNHIIRPLLFATRRSIEAYCKENKIFYREDKTNTDIKFKRNKIRHNVIPLLKEINPSIEFTLNETAERLSGINDIFSDFISKIRKAVFEQGDNIIVLKISKLKPYLGNNAILFELFRPFGITGSLLKDLMKVIAGRTGGQIFTGTHRMIKNRNEILISEQIETGNETFTIFRADDLKKSPLIASAKIVTVREDLVISPDPGTAYLDTQKIAFPVTIRKWKYGDFFYPFGMNRKKKLSDYFVDRKYSRLQKERVYILESDGKIVWIIGERIDNRFRITKATTKALVIKAQRRKGSTA